MVSTYLSENKEREVYMEQHATLLTPAAAWAM